MKTKVKIRENSLLAAIAARRMGYDRVALVVGHTIHLHNTPVADFVNNRSWLLHELKHVAQYEQLGIFGFLRKYLAESIRNGYYNNALEVEARSAEQDASLYARYDLSEYIDNPAG
jgi:hypothetical protein